MNLSKKFCVQLVRSCNKKQVLNSTNYNLFLSINECQTKLISRAVLTRPKELDELKKKVRERLEKNEYDPHGSKSDTDEINPIGYLLISIPFITFGLGTWQIWRRKWKLEIIKDLEDRMSREPIEMPENLDELANLEYCPIKVRGEFLYDREFVVGPRSLIVNGQGANEGRGNLISSNATTRGYNIITPFKLENRDLVILVNRGWLPNKYKLEEERKKCRMQGLVEFTGINRLNEFRAPFVPKNIPEKGMWYHRDLHQMAEYAHTEPIYLDMVESAPELGMPIGAQTRVNIRNDHLSYIATWYGLSALTGYYCYRMFILKKPLF